MPIFIIRHVTTYRYRQPVAFGEHRMMLRPRDDGDQIVLDSDLDIVPAPSLISWSRDPLGNHVATAHFADSADELRFVSTIRLEHEAVAFHAHDIAAEARRYPFSRPADRAPAPPVHPRVQSWAEGFLDADGSADTYALLVGMTRTIRDTFKHVARHQKGIQRPEETLALASGSCRDHALLMIAALHALGFDARFVSGYLYLAADSGEEGGDETEFSGGNTHAWVQVHVPGPGWVDFDPSSGSIGNRNLVRVAVVDDPREAIPLQGSWYGSARDQIAMKVAVKVAAATAQ